MPLITPIQENRMALKITFHLFSPNLCFLFSCVGSDQRWVCLFVMSFSENIFISLTLAFMADSSIFSCIHGVTCVKGLLVINPPLAAGVYVSYRAFELVANSGSSMRLQLTSVVIPFIVDFVNGRKWLQNPVLLYGHKFCIYFLVLYNPVLIGSDSLLLLFRCIWFVLGILFSQKSEDVVLYGFWRLLYIPNLLKVELRKFLC